MYETNIETVTVNKLPLEFVCALQMSNGKGIRLQSVESYNKKGEKIWDGLQSQFFGSDFSSDREYEECYSCKCKKYVGKAFQGKVCESCGTRVEYVDIDMEKTGWIILDHFKVVSPIYHAKLEEAFGKIGGESVFKRMIEAEFSDKDKRRTRFVSEKEAKEMKKHPYLKKGMQFFREHFEEIIDYYISKSKTKSTKLSLLQELKEDADKVFTSCIPVISAILRMELPGEKNQKLYKMKINTFYQSIIRSSNNINSFGDPEKLTYDDLIIIDRYLASIQEEIGEVFNEMVSILSGKKGMIIGKVISGRYDYSCRNIIIPGSGNRVLRSNEIAVGYITFAEMFRFEITNYYAKIHNCNVFEADMVWKKSLNEFNQEIYDIMNYINTEHNQYVNIMINRNPSINYLSYQMMKIAYIKPNIKDKTMCIPSRNLGTMGADYDGDQCNLYRVFGIDFDKKFRKNLDPRYNLFISRLDGKVNRAAMPIKDEVICFFQLNNL